MKTSNKDFDCVEMMHKGQAAIRKRLKGMTAEQQLEYWRRRTEELRSEQRERQRAKPATGKN